VLAIGIVVDDAIVVVENVERHLEHGLSRRDAALKTMEEVGGALVSIALVLCAVFVPTAFLGGISGQFFQQFAVTIAVATAISCFCSLTLSPALASQILQPHGERRPPARWNLVARGWDAFTGLFNRIFDRLSHGYARVAGFVIRHSVVMLLVYVVLIGSAGWLIATTPQGFIPAQDRGYVIVSVQLPGAASLARTTEIVRKIENIALATPGVVRVPALAGLSGATRTQASNSAALFPVFDEPEVRAKKGLTANAITAELRKRLAAIQGAFIIVIPPPAVPGIGTGGGFTMRIQDRQGRGQRAARRRDRRVGWGSAQGAGIDRRVLALQRQHPAGVRRYRSGQGREARRADCEHHRYDRDLFRLDLRQRLRRPRAGEKSLRAGRGAVPHAAG
jgi:multidrug efflux pump subunit AcrB